jgi:peroxiredoxin
MKKAIALVFCLAPIAFALPSGGDLTAEKVVERVSQTYNSLRSFRLLEHREGRPPIGLISGSPLLAAPQGLVNGKLIVPGSPLGILPEPLGSNLMLPARYETDLAESTPGRIRLGTGGMLVVSNGETMWAYLPVLKQYLQAAAVPLLGDMRTPSAYYGSDDVLRYRSLSHEAGRAKLRGEETLTLGAKEVPCYVVDVPSNSGSRRLWVDEQRFIVLQDEWASGPGSGPDLAHPNRSYFADAGIWTSRLTKADLGPISDETFEFTPPAGARRVGSFSAPSISSQGGVMGRAYQLAEGSVENLVYRLTGADVLQRMKAKKAPDFAAEGVDGRTLRLKDLRGKAVVLDFFATWCKPCREDFAAIQKLHADLRGRGVAFIGIDEDEELNTARDFAKQNGLTFPVLVDSNHTVPELYRTGWVPTVVAINRKGKIVAQYIGAGGEAQLRQALKAAGLDTTKP